MNPYETDPSRIPGTDLYADIPCYDSISYWRGALSRCTADVRIYPDEFGGRDVFALGGVIVKSSHLRATYTQDHTLADANEVAAIKLAKPILSEMKISVPQIYFAGKIDGRPVLIQERLPGVTLGVAWPYLTQEERLSFRQQGHDMIRELHAIKPSPGSTRSYVVPDPDPVGSRRVREEEHRTLFANDQDGSDLGLTHNDATTSNLIVQGGRITGVIDWEMAGFFGWKAAAAVHSRLRGGIDKDKLDELNWPADVLKDQLFWDDLYEPVIVTG